MNTEKEIVRRHAAMAYLKRRMAERQARRELKLQRELEKRRRIAVELERLKSASLTGYRLSPKQKAEIRERVQSGRHPLKGSGIWIDV